MFVPRKGRQGLLLIRYAGRGALLALRGPCSLGIGVVKSPRETAVQALGLASFGTHSLCVHLEGPQWGHVYHVYVAQANLRLGQPCLLLPDFSEPKRSMPAKDRSRFQNRII